MRTILKYVAKVTKLNIIPASYILTKDDETPNFEEMGKEGLKSCI